MSSITQLLFPHLSTPYPEPPFLKASNNFVTVNTNYDNLLGNHRGQLIKAEAREEFSALENMKSLLDGRRKKACADCKNKVRGAEGARGGSEGREQGEGARGGSEGREGVSGASGRRRKERCLGVGVLVCWWCGGWGEWGLVCYGGRLENHQT